VGRRPIVQGRYWTGICGAAASFRRLAALSAEVACFGHGEPLTGDAAAVLAAAAQSLPD
jgi:hypothetical protein